MTHESSPCLAAALESRLDAATNERAIQPFLKRHPILVRNAFNVWAWNYAEALPEFRLGADGRVDFLVLSADSCSWHAVFVELKSPTAQPFTKAGLPSHALNEALTQLDERERWVQRNDGPFREALSKHLRTVDAPAFCSNASEHQRGETEIRDPRTVIERRYVAVLGRRAPLSTEERSRRARLHGRDARIASYDRLIEVAAKLDRAESDLRGRATT